MFSMAMWMAALVAPVQIVVGDAACAQHFEHQPAKILAIEGYFHAYPEGAPWHIFGLPDDEARRCATRCRCPRWARSASSTT